MTLVPRTFRDGPLIARLLPVLSTAGMASSIVPLGLHPRSPRGSKDAWSPAYETKAGARDDQERSYLGSIEDNHVRGAFLRNLDPV
jgi:hypothetical protein